MLPNTYKCLFNQTVSINELIEWNGFKVIFEDYSYTLFPSTSRLSMGLGIIMKILNLTLRQGTENLQTFIKPLENQILINDKPILQQNIDSNLSSNLLFNTYKIRENKNLYFDFIFCFSLLIMIFLELDQSPLLHKLTKFSKKSGNSEKPDILNYILYTFLARYEPQYIDKVQDELDNCKFTPEQQTLIWQWVRREIDFVEKPEESENTDFKEN